jgi:hypothetical protein
MAVEFVNLVLRGAFGVHPTAKLLLVILAEHARRGTGGIAFPSVATQARLACISRRQVQSHLRVLVHEGWLIPAGCAQGGRKLAAIYRINVSKMQASTNTQKGEAHRTLSAAENAEKGAVQRTERVRPTSPQPVLNRNYEPVLNPRSAPANLAEHSNRKAETAYQENEPRGATPKPEIPRVPRRGDERAIDDAARALGLWPLKGEAGRDYDAALALVTQEIERLHRGN